MDCKIAERPEFGETLSDDEAETAEQTSDRREVAAGVTHLLADLSEREATIVSMRFGMGKYAAQGPRATEDVAKALGLSRERVHELETRAIGKLRTSAESTGFSSLLNPDHEDEE